MAALLLGLILFFFSPALAETIKLKSGQEIEGKILERTDKEVKIDFMGVPLIYFAEDIESIDTVLFNESRDAPEAPDDAETLFYQGIANAKKGGLDEAISDFSRAIESNPELAEGYYNRGVSYIKKGLLGQALPDFDKAIEIKPDYAEAYNNRAVAFFMKKEYTKAWEDVERAMELGYKVNLEFMDQLKRFTEEKK